MEYINDLRENTAEFLRKCDEIFKSDEKIKHKEIINSEDELIKTINSYVSQLNLPQESIQIAAYHPAAEKLISKINITSINLGKHVFPPRKIVLLELGDEFNKAPLHIYQYKFDEQRKDKLIAVNWYTSKYDNLTLEHKVRNRLFHTLIYKKIEEINRPNSCIYVGAAAVAAISALALVLLT